MAEAEYEENMSDDGVLIPPTTENQGNRPQDRPSGSLTVDLPITNDNVDEYEGSEDSEYDPDLELRQNAGFNSPKSDEPILQLDDDNYQGIDTPVQRENYGINSPRKSNLDNDDIKAASWSAANNPQQQQEDSEPGGALAGLVTQVQRPDANASPITQVDDNSQVEIRLASQQSSWGFLGCCLPCFASSPVDEPLVKSTPNDGRNEQYEKPPTAAPINDPQESSDSRENSADYAGGLLGPMLPEHRGRKCLVLDLDETLVHSSFKPVPNSDFIIPVEIDNVIHRVYVNKRPYCDEFLLRCAEIYEVVIFTASLAKYANPLLDQLDPHHTITHRLFRESCVIHQTAYVKDLTKLGRRLRDTIIVDNSPQSYLFHPRYAIPILSWFDDQSDGQLLELLPVLETTLREVYDVSRVLDAHTKSFKWLCNQANKTAQFS